PGGGAKAAHRIAFEREEPAPVRRIDPTSGTLRTDSDPTPVQGQMLAPDASLFELDALILDRLESRSLVFSGENGAALRLDFPDCPNLGIWQKPGAPFLAIEPWQGFNDPEGFDGDFFEKPGVVVLPAADSRQYSRVVSVLPAGTRHAPPVTGAATRATGLAPTGAAMRISIRRAVAIVSHIGAGMATLT